MRASRPRIPASGYAAPPLTRIARAIPTSPREERDPGEGRPTAPSAFRQAAKSVWSARRSADKPEDRAALHHLLRHKILERGHSSLHRRGRRRDAPVSRDAVVSPRMSRLENGRIAAADGTLIRSLVQGQIRRRPRPMMKGREAELGDSSESRKPPSVTTPATPRFISLEPGSAGEAARASLRLSITRTAPGGQSSIAARCGWVRSRRRDLVEVFARRNVAQRKRLADQSAGPE